MQSYQFFLKNRKKFIIISLIISLYLFIIIVFKTGFIQEHFFQPQQYSYLDLEQFINGYKASQKNFKIKKLFLTGKTLSFILNIKFKPKIDLEVRKLATDILLGIVEEYPELKIVAIDVVRETEEGAKTVYGRAYFDKEEVSQVTWKLGR